MKKKKSVEELIENLAIITNKGFEENAKQFKRIDERFEQIDTRFEKMVERFDRIDERFDKIEFLVGGHDRRLDILEDKVRQISVKVGLR
jgi:predicted transcriptional regulator